MPVSKIPGAGISGGSVTVNQSAPDNSLVIDSSGNVGVGNSSPAYRLDIVSSTVDGGAQITGAASGANLFLNNNGTNGRKYRLYSTGSSNAVGAGFLGFFDETAGLFRMGLDASGNLLIGTSTSVGTSNGLYCPALFNFTSGSGANTVISADGLFRRSTSSLKYKKDVQDATHGLAEVLQLRPVTYKGKAEFDGDKVFGGLIAEEVDAIGLTEFVQYAEDGSPDALSYGHMVSLLTKAIQEQQAQIEELKAEVQALKGAN